MEINEIADEQQNKPDGHKQEGKLYQVAVAGGYKLMKLTDSELSYDFEYFAPLPLPVGTSLHPLSEEENLETLLQVNKDD